MLEQWVDLLQAIVAILAALWGIYEHVRNRRFGAALDTSDRALKSMIVAIEVWGNATGNVERADDLKRKIQAVATMSAAEREKLKDLVESISEIIGQSETYDLVGDNNQLKAAAHAVGLPVSAPGAGPSVVVDRRGRL